MNKHSYQCPRCGSLDVYRSRRKGIIDRIISLFGFYPYVCEEFACRKRFYRASRHHTESPETWKS